MDVSATSTAITQPIESPSNVVFEDVSAASATTVMLPSEAVYASENGEFQHIEIITISEWT